MNDPLKKAFGFLSALKNAPVVKSEVRTHAEVIDDYISQLKAENESLRDEIIENNLPMEVELMEHKNQINQLKTENKRLKNQLGEESQRVIRYQAMAVNNFATELAALTDLEVLKGAFDTLKIKYRIEPIGGQFPNHKSITLDGNKDYKWNGYYGFEAYFAFNETGKLDWYGAEE